MPPTEPPTARAGAPRWLPAASLLLTVAGLAVAGYLTVEHYTASTTLACPETGVVNCQKVTTSAQSMVFGIPVALLGLLYFAAMGPLCLPVAWRSTRPQIRWGRIGAAALGVGSMVYLVYTELFTLNAICLWCTAAHVITLALFAVVVFGSAVIEPSG
jgi:uncharacterized membrane protein